MVILACLCSNNKETCLATTKGFADKSTPMLSVEYSLRLNKIYRMTKHLIEEWLANGHGIHIVKHLMCVF